MVHIQGIKSWVKEKNLGPTDGITNYITGWKLPLEPDGNAIFGAKRRSESLT